jgi:DNA-binding response OmpR family regulator
MKNKKRILIVEDELISAEYLKDLFIDRGYDVIDIIDNGQDAIRESKLLKPDIIIMDIMLKGGMSGCEEAVQIHQNNDDVKIIFLTSYSEQEMIDYAVDAHASAYLIKPYREDEILATMKLLTSDDTKIKPNIDKEKIELNGGYVFNTKLHRLFKENKEVQLGKKMLKLIEILALNKNVSVSNAQICTYIWGENKNDKTLRSLIHRIRSTINQDMIQNINGLGYKID